MASGVCIKSLTCNLLRNSRMLAWSEGLYAFMQRNAERSDAYSCIPVAQVVEIGIETARIPAQWP